MPKRMVKVNCLAMGTATPPVLKNSGSCRLICHLHKSKNKLVACSFNPKLEIFNGSIHFLGQVV